MPRTSLRIFAASLAAAAVAHAVDFPLSSAVSTYEQGAPFVIANSLTPDVQGWGVYVDPPGPGGQFNPQTGVFTAASPVTSSSVAFTLDQFLGDSHHIQRFRLSFTTDAAPGFASAWTELAPQRLRSSGGVTLSDAGSNMINAAGTSAGTSYQLLASGGITGATGFRLELFPVDYDAGDTLPASLGRAFNGNLVLSQFKVSDRAAFNWALSGAVTPSAGTFAGFPASNLTDGNFSSFSHPDNPPAQLGFSYTINLGESLPIALDSIQLANRNDGCCPERLRNYRVEVLDAAGAPVWSGAIRTDGSDSGVGGIDTVTAGNGAGTFEGNFVRITNLSGEAYNPQVAEVQVFGALVPEPSIVGLLAVAGAGLLARHRR